MGERQRDCLHDCIFLGRESANVLPRDSRDLRGSNGVREGRACSSYSASEVAGQQVTCCLTTRNQNIGYVAALPFRKRQQTGNLCKRSPIHNIEQVTSN